MVHTEYIGANVPMARNVSRDIYLHSQFFKITTNTNLHLHWRQPLEKPRVFCLNWQTLKNRQYKYRICIGGFLKPATSKDLFILAVVLT